MCMMYPVPSLYHLPDWREEYNRRKHPVTPPLSWHLCWDGGLGGYLDVLWDEFMGAF